MVSSCAFFRLFLRKFPRVPIQRQVCPRFFVVSAPKMTGSAPHMLHTLRNEWITLSDPCRISHKRYIRAWSSAHARPTGWRPTTGGGTCHGRPTAAGNTCRGRPARNGLDKSTAELGTEQAVDDEVDARVDVDEQLGSRLEVEDDVTAAVSGDDVADAVEHGQRRLADDSDEDHGDEDERHFTRHVLPSPPAHRRPWLPRLPTLYNTVTPRHSSDGPRFYRTTLCTVILYFCMSPRSSVLCKTAKRMNKLFRRRGMASHIHIHNNDYGNNSKIILPMPNGLGCESACRLPESTPTIAIYIITQPKAVPRRAEGWVDLVGWLHTEMVYRQSPISVLTGTDVAQLRWSTPTRYY